MAKNRRRKPAQGRDIGNRVLKVAGRLSLLTLVVSLMAGSVWGAREVYRSLDVPVRTIAVEGKFERITQAELQQVVQPLVTGGIVSLDLVALRDQLQGHPWISDVRVSRAWPDGVKIFVEEEVPIARWNDGGFLNSRGQLMVISDNSGLTELPQLSGPDGRQLEVMTRYREVAELIQAANLGVIAMAMDNRGVLQLRLNNEMDVKLGKGHTLEKMRRMLTVWHAGLAEKQAQISALDLRYNNGLAVTWRDKDTQTPVANRQGAATKQQILLTQQLNKFSSRAERTMRPLNG